MAFDLEEYGIYGMMIGASLIIVLSYFFNVISRKTNIPSVILLIALGVGINEGLEYIGIDELPFEHRVLEVLGTVGLIFIVLEAALDLEIKSEKWPIIWKSFLVALIALLGSTWAISSFLNFFLIPDVLESWIYAVPLSIMSSAIIIPSVGGLIKEQEEFMVYESTFSDILGIMLFYFLLENGNITETKAIVSNVAVNISITVVLSLVACYLLIFILQRISTNVKLFLTISVLILIYAFGKLYHLSPLIVILAFGLMLNNSGVFWRGKMKNLIDIERIKIIRHDFHILTLESAFVIRTFFFVIFGITIVLSSLFELEVVFYSMIVVVILYLVRLILLAIFKRNSIFPLLYIAPRGLITILLFFQIGSSYPEYAADEFNSGIILFVILTTSIVMTISLIQNGFGLKGVKRDFKTGDLEYSGEPKGEELAPVEVDDQEEEDDAVNHVDS